MEATAANTRDVPGWSATLHLRFGARRQRTCLIERQQRGPLAVQRSFYPEGPVCHTYLLHPPGGVVGGDRLDISAQADRGAHALLTTPGATKFYRSAGATALQTQTLHVQADATLEWLPQENIFFPGARTRLLTRVELERGARHCGWEIHCLGRPANHERFTAGRLDARLLINCQDRPLLRERLLLQSATDLDHASGLRGHAVAATLWATPADAGLVAAVRDRLDTTALGITLLDNLLVVRGLGDDAARLRQHLLQVWQCFREYSLALPACPPRIWAT